MFTTTLLRRYISILAVVVVTTLYASAADNKPADIVSLHLDSIAAPGIRATLKSRVVEGTFKFRGLVGGGEGAGTWGRVSSDRQSRFVLRFGSRNDWKGEQFVFDGSKADVAITLASHRRSDFGLFVNDQDFLIKEGLLGGELSTGWALQNLDANHARIEYVGMKKVDGKELLALQYFSKANQDLQVKLYFDPANYHHVLTVYSVQIQPHMSGIIVTSYAQKEVRYTVEERFGDFQTQDSVTLPRNYQLQFTEEAQDGATRIYSWDMVVKQVHENVSLDAANFAVK